MALTAAQDKSAVVCTNLMGVENGPEKPIETQASLDVCSVTDSLKKVLFLVYVKEAVGNPMAMSKVLAAKVDVEEVYP